MILIADSGSTKTSWILNDEKKSFGPWETIGLNPFFHDPLSISSEIQQHLVPQLPAMPAEIFFYGAGCKPEENRQKVKQALQAVFSSSSIVVDHDMMGAARALCQSEPGIVCILGTGSNSCLYDGKDIQENQTSLGYVLGDEGSGAVLGKELVRDYFYNRLPDILRRDLEQSFPMDIFEVIQRVYMKPYPNRYLAMFTRFLFTHQQEVYVSALLERHFGDFLDRNVLAYRRPDLKTHFMGSVAYHFKISLMKACEQRDIDTGKILSDALPGLSEFHRAFYGKSM